MVTCIRPNGHVHVQLDHSKDVIFAALVTVRPSPVTALEMRHLTPSKELVSALIRLVMTATTEMDHLEHFRQDHLRQQHVKLLQLRAARAVLANHDCLRLVLTSPVPAPLSAHPPPPDAALVIELLELNYWN